jgi:DnaJ homolog subfamily C member 2
MTSFDIESSREDSENLLEIKLKINGVTSSPCLALIVYDPRSPLNVLLNKPIERTQSKEDLELPDDIPLNVTPENLESFSFYDLFGLQAETFEVKQLRKAYHKACLVYHPDKRKVAMIVDEDGVENNSVFLKIQEAFAVLSDDDRRRVYDSQLPFDDSIPTESQVDKKMKKNPLNFYHMFDPVFKRNGRFAIKKPIPDLGDESTPIEEVLRFYEYWVHFESWRDFSGKDSEYNPEEATSREEKRWMQKENEKIGKKLKKKEMDRIIELVMLAQRKDPRIMADKEARRLAKEAERLNKEAEEQRKAKELADTIAAAERAELEAKELAAASKVDREKMKKIMSKARNILRKLLRHTAIIGLGDNAYGILTDEEQEILCSNSSLEELNAMNDAMGGEPATKETSLFQAEGVEVVRSIFTNIKARKQEEAEAERLAREQKKAMASNEKVKDTSGKVAEREWSRENLSMLAKAVAKFPAGQADRWGLITKFMNDSIRANPSFSQDECVKAAFNAAKNMQGGMAKKK